MGHDQGSTPYLPHGYGEEFPAWHASALPAGARRGGVQTLRPAVAHHVPQPRLLRHGPQVVRADQRGHPAGAASCHASSWPGGSSSSSSGHSCSGDCGCDDGGFSRGVCGPGGGSCGPCGSCGSGGSGGALPARRAAPAHAPGRKPRTGRLRADRGKSQRQQPPASSSARKAGGSGNVKATAPPRAPRKCQRCLQSGRPVSAAVASIPKSSACLFAICLAYAITRSGAAGRCL